MDTASVLNQLKQTLKSSPRMPVIFIGHGSPMNIIEDNPFSQSWLKLGESLPKPQAVLVVSAHWMTKGNTFVDVSPMPKTIYDFYGFPEALYAQQYPARGEPKLAREVIALLDDYQVQDDIWGLDHGAWAVLKSLFPEADVPVFQLSIDVTKEMNWHLGIGKTLSELRDKGVLILGSGNVVHNLHALRAGGHPHDWAVEFDALVANKLAVRDFTSLADPKMMGSLLSMANPTLEHYIPALTVAGASNSQDQIYTITEGIDLGSVSMRSFVFHGS
ncbi:4,5-DOPA dioxygenase extradiol [Vibrio sinaloensis]|uniref:4,5-DOPA-extradiol-dioxygenase n=1 Tax=Photobacterium sp. (strain ATCC 43367) TaxID=379097 RepID=UPI0022AE983D|nr:4,5-DOPA dioxygenase extradiol [Vibrio sinaloensis]MCZ4293417.1 4,5-DOPA dioxygenase extradiol [Vibrio sinaloensis]